MLVSDGSMDGTKAACAAELGTRVVDPDEFEVLLNHLQPVIPERNHGRRLTND
jgi:DNA polymerase-3 subunit epsilon